MVAAAGCTSQPRMKWDSPGMATNDGGNAGVAGILLRNAFLIGEPAGRPMEAGAGMPLYLVLINQSGVADRLISVSAPGVFEGSRLPEGGLEIPAGGSAGGTATPQAQLTGLIRPFRSGGTIPVTFHFEHAGAVVVPVPVLPPDQWRTTYSPWPSPAPSPVVPFSAAPSATRSPASVSGRGTPPPATTRGHRT
ncbi:copper chaperone PCu(A)C [Microbispora sp. RL4-1S]|uniref:Copper chaperone PCu(A)C n=1 Tax=Microbispora oryzae TaxID=2806554 RepID=A0A940WB32_9ACTN|nr:copper chaperone PCu(A)C [Microbispora oryzae]MBP2702211.1 copper chaperone PCu(A)C [Microbispora oryzae]